MESNIFTAKAVAKNIRMSPIKVRRVLKLIKNCSYQDAVILLGFLPYKACGPIWKVLYSAVGNAEYSYRINKKDLTIKELYVNQGRVQKRFRPRAQGRTFLIKKPFCHITAIVEFNKII